MLNQLLAVASLRKQQGLTTVEYAIAGGLVAVAVIAAFILLGSDVGNVITNITNKI